MSLNFFFSNIEKKAPEINHQRKERTTKGIRQLFKMNKCTGIQGWCKQTAFGLRFNAIIETKFKLQIIQMVHLFNK